MSENPFLKSENYGDAYQESLEKLRSKPEVLEFDKLCWQVFSTEYGKNFLEEVKSRFLIPGFIRPESAQAPHAALYFEGFKEAFRMILNCMHSHERRIEANQ